MGYGRILLDDAVFPNYHGSSVGNNSGTRMNHTARREGDVTAQVALLANHRFGKDFDPIGTGCTLRY